MLDEALIKEINTCPKAKSRAEERYILWRKIKGFGNKICFYLCRIFPIDRKLVSVCTFEGKGGFGCNPKYIVMELHKQRPDIKFVWFVNKDVIDKKEFPEYIKKVPNTLWSRAYWLSRSKVWIDNYRKPYGTVKRKGQYYVNTWHGAIYIKPIGLWRGSAFSKMAYLVSRNDSLMIDKMVIDSNWCEKTSNKGFVYDGDFLKVGMPRYDILCNDRDVQRKKIHNHYQIEENARIAIFAPTFREKSKDGLRSVHSEVWTLDFNKTISTLEKKFGGKWYLCIRVHPQLATQFAMDEIIKSNNQLLDGNEIEDMYELLAGMDFYISDYSSAAFESAYAGIPVLIFADDIERYAVDRGGLMWNITCETADRKSNVADFEEVEFPFGIARNNDELIQNISEFDYEKYEATINSFKENIGLIFEGKSSQEVVKQIQVWMR